LTHDLFFNFAKTFNIDLLEVMIHKLEEGVFHSKLTCHNSDQTIEIDTRTSDAIALALRFKCPIFTTSDIIERAGIILDFEQSTDDYSEIDGKGKKDNEIEDELTVERLSNYDITELRQMLDEAVKDEDYEKASMIRDEINRRKMS
jgi:bifunctional DNase/RNase